MNVGASTCIVLSVAALKNRAKITLVVQPLVQPEDGADRIVPMPKSGNDGECAAIFNSSTTQSNSRAS